MKVVIPAKEKGKRAYEVRVVRQGSFLTNSILGIVGCKPPRSRKWVCFLQIPGHDSNLARLSKGLPYSRGAK